MSQPADGGTNHRLVQALEHPVRAGFLRLLASRRIHRFLPIARGRAALTALGLPSPREGDG